METKLNIQVLCTGKFISGTRERFDKSFGNWLPPDYPEVEGLKVFLVKGNEKLEITDFLEEEELNELEDEFIRQREEG